MAARKVANATKKASKVVAKQSLKTVEDASRRAILEDLFYDFYTSRKRVYLMNFVRGMFFGVGSVIGGTLLVAIVLGVLSWFTDIPGGFGDFIQFIVNTVHDSSNE